MNQKFELRGYSVLFDINDGLIAEDLLDGLDRATSLFKHIYNLESEPKAEFYLVKDSNDLKNNFGLTSRPGEIAYIDKASDSIFIFTEKLKDNCGEIGVREFGHLIFDKTVNECEVRMRQLRTPSWLREGIVSQASYYVRKDQIEWLKKGWELLRVAQKNGQLVKPNVMVKDIAIIPDPSRRELAFFQSYYMVKLLLTMYCDSFFAKYSTLMKALDDMEAETCFRQITSFDFNKFFSMFDSWVTKTNAWTAME